jgi:hypothetical protein
MEVGMRDGFHVIGNTCFSWCLDSLCECNYNSYRIRVEEIREVKERTEAGIILQSSNFMVGENTGKDSKPHHHLVVAKKQRWSREWGKHFFDTGE